MAHFLKSTVTEKVMLPGQVVSVLVFTSNDPCYNLSVKYLFEKKKKRPWLDPFKKIML